MPEARAARSFLLRLARGGLDAATATLTWDEFAWAIRKQLGAKLVQEHGRRLLTFPNLQFLPVTKDTIERAQALAESRGFRPRDAIHAASALNAGATQIVTFDPDLSGIPGLSRVEP